jgi:hypothetical protein
VKYLARVRIRQGRCYELAYRVMLYEPGAGRFSLIHGRIAQLKGMEDMLVPHAWIELDDGRIYDPSMHRYFPADEYVASRLAVVERRYSHVEAMSMAVHGRCGPWH